MKKRRVLIAIIAVVVVAIGAFALWWYSPGHQDELTMQRIEQSTKDMQKAGEDYAKSKQVSDLFDKALNAKTKAERQSLLEQAAKVNFGNSYELKILKLTDLNKLDIELKQLEAKQKTITNDDEMEKCLDRQLEIAIIEAYNDYD